MTYFNEKDKYYYYSFNVLRLILPLFVCVNSFGVSAISVGSRFVQAICGFAAVTFFVLSGFLVLGDEDKLDEKLGRAIKRAGIMFGAVFVLYVLFNVIFWLVTKTDVFPGYDLKSTWFNFIVLNRWPLIIGENIWFIQCLLYGYIAVFVLKKFKLLQYDRIIFAVCMALALLTGEFAGLINFRILDYTYVPANVITRSLPYLLLGRIIARNRDGYKKKKKTVFLIILLGGIMLSVAEYWLLTSFDKLVYSGHLIGSGVIAAALVILFSQNKKISKSIDLDFSNGFAKAVYILHQPIGFVVIGLVSSFKVEWLAFTVPALPFVLWIIIFIISLLTKKILNDMFKPVTFTIEDLRKE